MRAFGGDRADETFAHAEPGNVQASLRSPWVANSSSCCRGADRSSRPRSPSLSAIRSTTCRAWTERCPARHDPVQSRQRFRGRRLSFAEAGLASWLTDATLECHPEAALRGTRRDRLPLAVGAENVREIGMPVDRLKPLVRRGLPAALPAEFLRHTGSLLRLAARDQDAIAAGIRCDEIFAGKTAKGRPRATPHSAHGCGGSAGSRRRRHDWRDRPRGADTDNHGFI